MIHGGTNHPVLIKKIKLNIWLLRDELEAVVAHRLANLKQGEEVPSIEDLIEEYSPKELIIDKDGAELKAVEADQDPESEPTEENDQENNEEESEESEDNLEDEMAKAMVDEQSEDQLKQSATVYLRRPPISQNKIYKGQAILSEIDMNGMNFFSNHRFVSGQSIVIEFLVPKRFIINADILFTRSFNMHSRIISEDRHPYRIATKFTFLRKGERTLLRNFVQSIEPDLSKIAAPVLNKATVKSNESDDFDDLDDFDL